MSYYYFSTFLVLVYSNNSIQASDKSTKIESEFDGNGKRLKNNLRSKDDSYSNSKSKYLPTDSDGGARWKRSGIGMNEDSSVKASSSSKEERSERTHSASRYERGDKGRDPGGGSGRRSLSRGSSSWGWKGGLSGNLKSRKDDMVGAGRRGFSRGHGQLNRDSKGDDQGHQKSRLTNSSSMSNLNGRNITSSGNDHDQKFSKGKGKNKNLILYSLSRTLLN